jgi:hypothetical protein
MGLARKGFFQAGEKVLFMHTGGLPALHMYEGEVLGRVAVAEAAQTYLKAAVLVVVLAVVQVLHLLAQWDLAPQVKATTVDSHLEFLVQIIPVVVVVAQAQ